MNWGIWSYQLPLRYPLAVLKEHKKYRRGLILGKKIQGTWKYGEASPLPTFHQTTFKQTLLQLSHYCMNKPVSLSSVSQFAIDMLEFNPKEDKVIGINRLMTHETEELLGKEFCNEVLKVKVGRQSLSNDRQFLLKIHNHFQSKITFRLDANRLWNSQQAQDFIHQNQDLNIEYIEEPTHQVQDIQYLDGMNIALDESLVDHPEARFYPQVSHLIIKPTLQGGINKTKEWAAMAQEEQQQIVISSTFETSLGIWALGHLAADCAAKIKHGLDTLRWFHEDLVEDRIEIRNGNVHLPKEPPRLNVNKLKLEASG